MTTIRGLCCNDLLRMSHIHLEHLVQMKSVSWYFNEISLMSNNYLVAVAAGHQIMGFCASNTKGVFVKKHGVITDIIVSQPYRENDLVMKFLEVLEETLEKKDQAYILDTFVHSSNTRVIELYEGLGFFCYEQVSKIDGKKSDIWKLRKPLSRLLDMHDEYIRCVRKNLPVSSILNYIIPADDDNDSSAHSQSMSHLPSDDDDTEGDVEDYVDEFDDVFDYDDAGDNGKGVDSSGEWTTTVLPSAGEGTISRPSDGGCGDLNKLEEKNKKKKHKKRKFKIKFKNKNKKNKKFFTEGSDGGGGDITNVPSEVGRGGGIGDITNVPSEEGDGGGGGKTNVASEVGRGGGSGNITNVPSEEGDGGGGGITNVPSEVGHGGGGAITNVPSEEYGGCAVTGTMPSEGGGDNAEMTNIASTEMRLAIITSRLQNFSRKWSDQASNEDDDLYEPILEPNFEYAISSVPSQDSALPSSGQGISEPCADEVRSKSSADEGKNEPHLKPSAAEEKSCMPSEEGGDEFNEMKEEEEKKINYKTKRNKKNKSKMNKNLQTEVGVHDAETSIMPAEVGFDGACDFVTCPGGFYFADNYTYVGFFGDPNLYK